MPLIAPSRALLSLGFIASLAACSNHDAPPPTARTVLVQAAIANQAGPGVYTGEVRARHEVDLSFRVAGKLVSRLVDSGAEIKAGQPLARLDPADLQLAAASAKAQLGAAESEFSTAKAERERYAGLLAKKFVSQAAFDGKENAFNAARGRLEQARAQNQISANQAGYGTLSSEYPAVVTAVLADAGQVLGAGQSVFRIARPEEKEVAISVPEGRVAEIKAAKNIAVNLWADANLKLQGELRELSAAADPATRTYAARIRIKNPPPEVRLGMTARVALGDAKDTTLLVPLGAVVDGGQGPVVWVAADGKATPHPVQISQFREDGAAIASGLQAGELVIVSGASKLVAGQSVTPKAVTPANRQR